jgi:hypothetical protein
VIVYEVTLAVAADAAGAYAAWLGPHIREVLACDGFRSAEWFEVEPDGEADGQVRWCVQYRLESRAALDAYLAGPAQRLRAEGVETFGGRFTATRRVLALREAAAR